MGKVIYCCLSSFLLSYLIIPSLIRIAKRYSIYDLPDDRKSHKDMTPQLGGIGIFIGFMLPILFWAESDQILGLQYILFSLLSLFFLGVKDDLLHVKAYKKLVVQIFAAFVVVYFAEIRLSSLYGLFWIYDIPILVSFLLTIFTIVVITNAFNLIDGINTLATTQSIWVSAVIGTWFFIVKEYEYALLSFSVMGSLFGFLKYNKTPAKIFMGDTGSTILGFTLAILVIKFIEINRFYDGKDNYQLYSVPAVAISILIIPLFDTLRVFTVRILKKRSPFSPDRSHLHHLLVDRGISHEKASLCLLGISFFLSVITFLLQHLDGELLLLFLICAMSLITYFFKRNHKEKR